MPCPVAPKVAEELDHTNAARAFADPPNKIIDDAEVLLRTNLQLEQNASHELPDVNMMLAAFVDDPALKVIP
jgi:hypothetical protein